MTTHDKILFAWAAYIIVNLLLTPLALWCVIPDKIMKYIFITVFVVLTVLSILIKVKANLI